MDVYTENGKAVLCNAWKSLFPHTPKTIGLRLPTAADHKMKSIYSRTRLNYKMKSMYLAAPVEDVKDLRRLL